MSKYFSLVANSFDVLPLQAALHRRADLFGVRRHRAEMYQSPHAAMSDIWIRYNDQKNLDPANLAAFNEEHESVWYDGYYALPELKPILFDLMRLVEGERLGGVLITKVPPGGRIAAHTDAGWHATKYQKFYVPIQADPGATFEWEDGVIEPVLGQVYWFRNDVPHWVENRSARDRISLIVCIETPFRGVQ
jgi:hypothetical protein